MFGLKVCDKLLVLVNLCLYLSQTSCNVIQNNTFAAPQIKSGGWTPIPTNNNKNFKGVGSVDKVVSESIQVSSKVQHIPEKKKTQDSEMLPIPVIKPHRHGATLGFDLPEQGLTLYLDINELATKPLAQNIGLKVVSHETHQAQQSQTQPLNHVKLNESSPSRLNSGSSTNNHLFSGKESPQSVSLSQFVNKMQSLNNNNNNNNNNNINNHQNKNSPLKGNTPITVAKIQKRVKSLRNIGSYEGNGGSPSPASKPSSLPKPMNKYHVGYVRPHDLQKALKQVGLNQGNSNHGNSNNGNSNHGNSNNGNSNHGNSNHGNFNHGNSNQVNSNHGQMNNREVHNFNNNNNFHRSNNLATNSNSNNNNNLNPSTRTVVINTHSLNNINYEKLFNEPNKKLGGLETFTPNPNKYFSPISVDQNFGSQMNANTNGNQQKNNRVEERPVVNSPPEPSSYTYSSLQMPIRPSVQFPVQEQDKEIPEIQKPEPPVQQISQEDIDFDNEVTTRKTTTLPPPVLPPQEEDQQQKEFDDDIEQTTESLSDNRYDEPQRQVSNGEEQTDNVVEDKKPMISVVTPSTNGQIIPSLDDDTIIKPFPGPKPQDLIDSCPSVHQMCQQICDAKTDNLISEAANIRDVAIKLKADNLLNIFPTLMDELQNIVDFASSEGYTIVLPSNEAVSRLPPNLLEFWKNNVNSLTPLLDNHIIERAQSLEEMRLADIIQPRSASKLRVQRPHNDSYTINGERVVMGNQVGPSGGQIHVIDGILYPNSEKDIMDTLKSCNRLDGFVTLAEGTGFADTLKQSGPFTVFVPSNEALQKVPDNDLDIIRNNMTALREFLKYHVANGSHYSNDLKDGQFIPSLIDGQYIQVGVRVDGCRRRLVEANVSPLYRADIPASNGVIHVVDWILKPTDRDWCENIILPR